MSDDMERLAWQCRRGMLELDLLLKGYLTHQYAELNASKQAIFRRLLDCGDQDLYDWFMHRAEPTDRELKDVIEAIRHTAAH